MSEVGVLAAFAAGILALFSPCSALLLPSFFAYAFATRRALVARTMVFYLGPVVTLVPLGTGASAASSLFYGHRPLLIAVAGWTIIGLGVLKLLGRGVAVPGAQRLQAAVSSRGDGGWLSTLVLGAVYGLAGFCSGPVLGAILTVAATQDSPWKGAAGPGRALGQVRPGQPSLAAWTHPVPRHVPPAHDVAAGGVLFMTVGIVFLRYDGTSGLTGSLGLGDFTDLEFSAQRAVTEMAAQLPAWVLPLVVVVVALAVAWRRRPTATEEPSAEPASADTH